MQVIKYGRIKAKRTECKGCRALLEYIPRDVKVKRISGHATLRVTCPICGRSNEAESWEV